MYESSDKDSSNVEPYRASGNLNTSIGIPNIDVNDAMNMNIQSVNTNSSFNNSNDMSQNVANNIGVNNGDAENNNIQGSTTYQDVIDNDGTLASNNAEDKKKKITLNLRPEFKLALLIIVVLLVFVFLLPVITSLFSD